MIPVVEVLLCYKIILLNNEIISKAMNENMYLLKVISHKLRFKDPTSCFYKMLIKFYLGRAMTIWLYLANVIGIMDKQKCPSLRK